MFSKFSLKKYQSKDEITRNSDHVHSQLRRFSDNFGIIPARVRRKTDRRTKRVPVNF